MTKRIASLSLDLDNKWSYLKTHGDEGWEEYPSYLDLVVPRVLETLEKIGLRITFFVVGRDAASFENRAALQAIVDAGHEIGNHSYNHEPWLHLYEPGQIEDELSKTEAAIADATGEKPIGFRGPGYSCSPELLANLSRRGYLYDASKLPTFIGPFARAYYLLSSGLEKEERAKRKQLFGSLSEVFCPLEPFRWTWQTAQSNDAPNPLVEIPVTTMPYFRMPFHFSYLLYMYQYSPRIARFYWRTSLLLCRWSGVEPSLLLHPLDFLDAKDEPSLDFFPGMRVDNTNKRAFLEETLRELSEAYEVLTMSEHAQSISRRENLKTKELACEACKLPVELPASALEHQLEETCTSA